MTAHFNHAEISAQSAGEASQLTAIAKTEGQSACKWPLLFIVLGIALTVGWIGALAWIGLYLLSH